MAAAQYDFKPLNHGDTLTGTFTAMYATTKLPKDLSGATVQLLIWAAGLNPAVDLPTLTVTNGGQLTLDGPNGKISLQVTTTALNVGSYYYKLKITDAAGILKTYGLGYIPIEP